jgi:lipid-binding SYLF domain-containing protein
MANMERKTDPLRAGIAAALAISALGLVACDADRDADVRTDDQRQAAPAITAEPTASPDRFASSDPDTAPTQTDASVSREVRAEQQVDASQVASERAELDQVAASAVADLKDEVPVAEALRYQAFGYAVFDAGNAGLLISGGGGAGVAVSNDSDERTYMYMASAGAGAIAGGQDYQLVLLFEDQETFNDFIEGELDASVIAQAALGPDGKSAIGEFSDGVAAYQLTEQGLVAGATLDASYFWPSDELNAGRTATAMSEDPTG